MIKINFEDITVFADIERKTALRKNLKQEVANSLYQYGQGIAFHALALKIYNSKGELELDDEEYELLMAYARQMCTPAIIDALESYGKEDEEDN